jgi:predicted ArsR family transcriptional regulator
MLFELRRYLARAGPLTATEAASHLDIEPAAAEGLLDILVRRGDVERNALAAICDKCSGGCGGACGMQDLTFYWLKGAERSS